MADVEDERVTFGKLTKAHSQYGTTSSAANVRLDNIDSFIIHAVHVSDTLQGIAVKYGVTVSIRSVLAACQLSQLVTLLTCDNLLLHNTLRRLQTRMGHIKFRCPCLRITVMWRRGSSS